VLSGRFRPAAGSRSGTDHPRKVSGIAYEQVANAVMALAFVASQVSNHLRVAPALLRYRPFFTSTAAADAPPPVSAVCAV
jgi:hypothetical protein